MRHPGVAPQPASAPPRARDRLWSTRLPRCRPHGLPRASAVLVSSCQQRRCCFGRFSICPQMDTSIQIGPTGKKLLPLTVKGAQNS
ncbi:hypothetical protein DMA10_21915 [Streptomyces sp. WAC 01420]|nr:hypothetical protein DMA10_21915 [Streptomyces sp. WAC 01420]